MPDPVLKPDLINGDGRGHIRRMDKLVPGPLHGAPQSDHQEARQTVS
ncbi:hypothetical protein LDL36_03165 [Komagataeibacter sp. FNDCR1]|nr:hypothetical protein [Komagataeibacter sp. FNDCR1]